MTHDLPMARSSGMRNVVRKHYKGWLRVDTRFV